MSTQSKDTFIKALFKTGATLQYKTVAILKRFDWDIKVEQAYKDDTENKVRQCDIIATKKLAFDTTLRLVIECKYIKSGHLIFFVDSHQPVITSSIMSESIFSTDAYIKEKLAQEATEHRYYQKSSSSYVCINGDLNNGYRPEEDSIYKGISQSIKPILDRSKTDISSTVTYPIVVVGDAELYKCDVNQIDALDIAQEDIPANLLKQNRVCLEYSYITDFSHEPMTFIVDIVKFSEFENFIKDLSQIDEPRLKSISANRATMKDIRHRRQEDDAMGNYNATSYI